VLCCAVLHCVLQPALSFTPPELVGGCGSDSEVVLSGAVDCFSLAALTYLLAAGQAGYHMGGYWGVLHTVQVARGPGTLPLCWFVRLVIVHGWLISMLPRLAA
jgi:hypothetical protein